MGSKSHGNWVSVQIHSNSECLPIDITQHMWAGPLAIAVTFMSLKLYSCRASCWSRALCLPERFWKLQFPFSTQGGCRKSVFDLSWTPPPLPPPPHPCALLVLQDADVTHLGLVYTPLPTMSSNFSTAFTFTQPRCSFGFCSLYLVPCWSPFLYSQCASAPLDFHFSEFRDKLNFRDNLFYR